MFKQVPFISFIRAFHSRTGMDDGAAAKRVSRSLLKMLLPVFFVFTGLGVHAQDVGMQWAKAFVATPGSSSIPYAVDTDASGNVYVTGYFNGTVDFDPGSATSNLTATGSNDVFFTKLDQFGNFIWAKRIGGISPSDGAYSMEIDAVGNLYIGGSFGGTVDFNPGAAVNNLTASGTGSIDAFILKLDSNGNYVWAQRMGTPDASGEIGFEISLDAGGNIYIAGYIGAGVATFGALSITGAGSTDGYVAKLNPAGVFQWVKRLGGAGGDLIYGLDVDASGNVYVAGTVGGPATGLVSMAAAGSCILKLDTSGNLVWSNFPADCPGFRTLQIDSQGNVYAGGVPGGTVDLIKLNNSGVRQWAQLLGDRLHSIDIGADDTVYMSGNFNGTTNMGPFTLTSVGALDGFVAAVNPAGDVLWAKAETGPDNGALVCISVSAQGEVYTTGYQTGTIDFDPSDCVFNLTGPASPFLTGFVWKLTEKPLPDGVTPSPSTLSLLTQNACSLGIPQLIEGNAVGLTAPIGFTTAISYQWQKSTSATGPWTDMPGEVFKDLQPEASSETLFYKRLVRAKTVFCDLQTIGESGVATVNIGGSTAPNAIANGPQWYVCGGANPVALNGSATGGTPGYTYQWYNGSSNGGTPLAATANLTTPTITQSTTFTLKVTDAAGCIDTDQVTIVPAVANAGPDLSMCQGSGGVQIGTSPVASPSVKYAWTVVSGTAGSLSCTTCAQPIANPAVTSVYQLTVTTTRKDGTTCSTTDNVSVAPVLAPGGTNIFAGTDKTICINSNVQLGSTTDATYAYTWTTGQFLSATNVARPTFTAGSTGVEPCAVTYAVTAVKSGCSFTDEVKVSVINSQTSDTGDTECGPRWVEHEGFPNCAQAVYTWSIVSGNGVIVTTRNGGEDAYLKSNAGTTKFRRTVTLNGVSCSSDVDIIVCGPGGCDAEIEVTSSQGCPKVFPGQELRLASKYGTTADWNFKWSPANLVDNATAKEVKVLTSSPATITLTMTSKYDATITCSESIDLNPAGAAQPAIDLVDKSICFNTPTAIGSPVSAGLAYTWLPATGLDNASSNNPLATLTADQQFVVKIEETASGCMVIDTISVKVAQVAANAGIDRTICNGATVTLGTAAPAGTNWTYAWEPAGAAWTNGTSATSAQPQVEFSATGNQTFTVTVTDPLSGCTATDDVVLKNTLTPGEYTGSAVTVCEGEEVQLGRAPEAGATYLWTGAGLSCTNCSNPVATPSTTTIYSLQIIYPGCSAPMVDEVTVTVNEIPDLTLVDVYACAPGAVAIGYGATGNPVAPAGATYLWSPSTGLSSTTAANPTATVTVQTTYSVLVTLLNGCTFTGELDVIPTAGAGNDAAICLGEATQIGSPAIAGATYAWTGAGIVGSATVAQPNVKPTVTTTYTVSVTVSGCTRTDNVIVTVNQPAAFNITGNTAICVGGSTVLSLVGAPAAGTTWQWSPLAGVGSPTGTSTKIVATATQTYRLTQTNLSSGCSNFKEVIVVVKPNTITATATPLEVCDGVSAALPLSVTAPGDYQYVWSPATGLSNPYIANPTVTTSTNRTYNVVITDNVSQCQLAASVPVTLKTGLECLPPVALSGNVFHDANALKDVTVNETVADPIPTLYVSLLNTAGTVLKTVAVNPDGSYDFGLTAAGTYNIALHQNLAGSATPDLPASWMNTGENLGAGVGSDDAVSGVLTSVTVRNVDVTNANFGIQQPPLAEPKIYVIDQPVADQMITLNGTHVSTGAGTSSPAQMTGTDPEDGVLIGDTKNRTVVITTLADHGELWYNGVLVTTGQVIPNYDPALMQVKLTGTGYTDITYLYAYVDQADVQSPPVTYKISWGAPLPVTLVSFEAKAVENTALLSWTTTAESNSDRFEIERSLNGKKWERIGTVNAQGESAATVRYSFKDLTPADAHNYYRLKMIDRAAGRSDLTFSYSGIRSASFDFAFETSIFPNPVADKVNLKATDWKKVASVRIYNMAGLNVYQSGPVVSEVIQVSSLPSGSYILSITNVDGSVRSHKMVHIK